MSLTQGIGTLGQGFLAPVDDGAGTPKAGGDVVLPAIKSPSSPSHTGGGGVVGGGGANKKKVPSARRDHGSRRHHSHDTHHGKSRRGGSGGGSGSSKRSVTVHVVDGPSFDIKIGRGKQTVKWLTLATTARMKQEVPRGSLRQREHGSMSDSSGALVPARVDLKETLELPVTPILPTDTLDEILSKGRSELWVTLQRARELDRVGGVKASDWQCTAFQRRNATAAQRRYERKRTKGLDAKLMALKKSCLEMGASMHVASLLADPLGMDELVMFENDWAHMVTPKNLILPPTDTKQIEELHSTLRDAYPQLRALFKNYCHGDDLDVVTAALSGAGGGGGDGGHRGVGKSDGGGGGSGGGGGRSGVGGSDLGSAGASAAGSPRVSTPGRGLRPGSVGGADGSEDGGGFGGTGGESPTHAASRHGSSSPAVDDAADGHHGGVGGGGAVFMGSAAQVDAFTMSRSEFYTFANDCRIGKGAVRPLNLNKIYQEAVLGTDAMHTAVAEKMTRSLFLDAVVLLAAYNDQACKPAAPFSSAAPPVTASMVRTLMQKHVLPRARKMASAGIRKELSSRKVAAQIVRDMELLRQAFEDHAVSAARGRDRTIMTQERFIQFLYATGLVVCEGVNPVPVPRDAVCCVPSAAVDEDHGGVIAEASDITGMTDGRNLQDKEVEACFVLSQAEDESKVADPGASAGDAAGDHTTLVFSEFVEALARVADKKWPTTEGVALAEKVALAVDAIAVYYHFRDEKNGPADWSRKRLAVLRRRQTARTNSASGSNRPGSSAPDAGGAVAPGGRGARPASGAGEGADDGDTGDASPAVVETA